MPHLGQNSTSYLLGSLDLYYIALHCITLALPVRLHYYCITFALYTVPLNKVQTYLLILPASLCITTAFALLHHLHHYWIACITLQ